MSASEQTLLKAASSSAHGEEEIWQPSGTRTLEYTLWPLHCIQATWLPRQERKEALCIIETGGTLAQSDVLISIDPSTVEVSHVF